jgi:hypothetical protein
MFSITFMELSYMSEIRVAVPDECEVRGAIYESNDARDLSEDMLEISLPGGLLIQCGWQDSAYVVELVRGLSHLIEPVRVRTAAEAGAIVQGFAMQICGRHSLPSSLVRIQKQEPVAV